MLLGRLLLAVAGHDLNLFALSTDLFVPSSAPLIVPSLAVHQTPVPVNGCFHLLLYSLSLCCVLPGRATIKSLAFSLVWYLGPPLLLSQYSRKHLLETINN